MKTSRDFVSNVLNELIMKTRTYFTSVIAALLVSCIGSASAQSESGQERPGLVLKDVPVKTAVPAQAPSSYSRFIDPVNGLTADEVVRYALRNNGELQAARQMIAEARGRLRQAGLRPNPMVEGSYGRAANTSDNNTMVGAQIPLELGGRREARVAVASRELVMREAEVADFERKLAAEVRMKYAEVIAAGRNLKFTEDLLALTRDSHRLVQARVERGKSAPLEQNLVLVEVNRVDAMRINFESRVEVAMFDLKKTAGMAPSEPLRLRGDFEIDSQPIPQSEAVRNALSTRPDLLAARAAEELALAQIEQARVEGKVDASIFANYMRQNMGFGVRGFNEAGQLAPVQGIFHYLTFGVQVTLPVRNKNQGNIEAAQASLEAARNRRQFGEIVVRNEVAAAYARFERARAALAVYRDGVRGQAMNNLEVIRQTYEFGQKSLLDFVSEQRRFIEVETGYTDALKEYLESLIEIKRAAGAPVPTA
jgi:cobalt-zinc-cadmium efflux system outer membrane protein